MPWKKNKNKRSDKGKLRPVPEEGPQTKLKSCLKKKTDVSSSDQDSSQAESIRVSGDTSTSRDHSSRSAATRSIGSTNGSKSVGTNGSPKSLESRGSGSSSLLRKGPAGEQMSCTSEGSSADNAHSSLNSQRSNRSNPVPEENKKRVRFNAIQIRDYERIVGDNPSCTAGPPLSIGWKYGTTTVIDVNSYEQARPYRKSSVRLILPREEREALLLNWGASFHDIVESVRGNIKVKNQRRQTVTNLGKVERIEEAFESATRTLKRALLLRRSTGNKVKRLQEQANLAQSALTSLKIAEEKALNEIRRGRIATREEPEKDELETYNLDVTVANFGRSAPVDSKVRRPHLVVSEEDDYYSTFDAYTLGGNSTTPSQLEMERFYRELELEMFGDEELPSMVGQTLELPADIPPGEKVDDETSSVFNFNLDDSLNSGIPPSTSDLARRSHRPGSDGDDLDAALERERNRSMISQSLLDDEESEAGKVDHPYDHGDHDALHFHYPLQRMYPVHGDYVSSRYHAATSRLSSSLDSADPNRARWTESVVALEYQFKQQQQMEQQQYQPTIPLHAGMSMFEDCALLGGQNDEMPLYCEKSRRSPRQDSNAGPKVQHLPPPSHLSPSHWMDDLDSPPVTFGGGYQTITINEDSDDADRNPNMYSHHGRSSGYVAAQQFPSSFY
mmetsp:Transcript_4086/g.6430  ORF Transcript_4086/g.6430 Transcript_4086/m.6430 type:complete len:673 (-) Transcript_4086:101-2119(-)